MATYSIWCGPGSAVANQTATFGAQTIATAGGFRPVSSTGQTVALSSYNSLVSGSLGIYTPVISGGTLIFTGGAGAPNGAVLRCGLALGGTVDITIATQANTYSVATVAEINAALSAIGSAGGKTVLIRRGAYSTAPVGSVVFGNGVTYSSAVTMQGEGTLAQREAGYGAKFTPYISVNNVSNIVWSGVEVSSPDGYPSCFELTGTNSNITIQDCYLHGKYYDPTAVSGFDWSNCHGVSVDATTTGLTIQRNLIEHVAYGFLFNELAGTTNIDLNEIRFMVADGAAIGWSNTSAAVNFSRNVIYSPVLTAAETHADGTQIAFYDSSVSFPSLTMRQNIYFMTPALSSGYFTGIVNFPGTSLYGRRIQNAVIAGNIVVHESVHGISSYCVDGGFIGYNTMVRHNTTGSGPDSPSLNLGQGQSYGTVKVKNNVADGYTLIGGATYTQANNVTLGNRGGSIAYSAAFNWSDSTVSANTRAQIMANLTPKAGGAVATANAGAIGSGYGTFGNPRDPTGWSYNAGLEA